MKYHYVIQETFPKQEYGVVVRMRSHPIVDSATLFQIGNKGILVVQEKWLSRSKARYWRFVDPALASDIYTHPKFADYFKKTATEEDYPIIQVRKLMWALRMKPLPKEFWEVGP